MTRQTFERLFARALDDSEADTCLAMLDPDPPITPEEYAACRAAWPYLSGCPIHGQPEPCAVCATKVRQ